MATGKGGVNYGHRTRMRKKFLEYGCKVFEPHEILELLLFYSIPRKNTNQLAHEMMDKYKTLANVFEASVEELRDEFKLTEVGATLIAMIPELSKAYEDSKWGRKAFLPDTESLGRYVVNLFKDKKYEEFSLICMNTRRFVTWSGPIIKGTIDETEAYPRIVVEESLRRKAVNVVFAHNHPGGTLAPSVADKQATEILVKILKSIGINVLDHIIVSGDGYFSMAEMGFFG